MFTQLRSKVTILTLMMFVVMMSAAFANPAFISKPMDLVNQAKGWIAFGAVAVGSLAASYQAFLMLTHANESSVVSGAKAKIKQIVFAMIILGLAPYIIEYVYVFFK